VRRSKLALQLRLTSHHAAQARREAPQRGREPNLRGEQRERPRIANLASSGDNGQHKLERRLEAVAVEVARFTREGGDVGAYALLRAREPRRVPQHGGAVKVLP